MKEDVDKYPTTKEDTILEVAITPIQKTYYKAIYEKNNSFIFKGAKPDNSPSLINLMKEIRNFCNQLLLIRGYEECILSDAAASGPHKPEQEK